MSDRILGVISPVRLEYTFTAGRAQSRFLRGVAQRRFLGQRCAQCGGVYVPSRGSCPVCGLPTDEEVEVGPRGTVMMLCVVNFPSYGRQIQPPYACASIQLDGADVSLFHLVQEIDASAVHTGLRVEPVWDDDPRPSMESIKYFRPVRNDDA